MDYNWEKIFKEKSTAELYEIYCGNSFLPISTISFARKELEYRNFNFGKSLNLEIELKFKALAEEYATLITELKNYPQRSISNYLIGYALGLVVALILLLITDIPRVLSLLVLVFMIISTTIEGLVNNKIRKKKLEQMDLLEKELNKLIIEKNLNDPNSRLSTKDFEKEVQSELDNINGLGRLLVIISLIALTSYLVYYLVKLFLKIR